MANAVGHRYRSLLSFASMSVDYTTALRRLENHANMPGSDDSPASSSFLELLRVAEASTAAIPGIEQLAADVVRCLQVANVELNGSNPSQSSSGLRESIPLRLAYTVSGILSGSIARHRRWVVNMQFPAEHLETLERAIHMISYSWDQLLAGDVDDLNADWELSEWASGERSAGGNAG